MSVANNDGVINEYNIAVRDVRRVHSDSDKFKMYTNSIRRRQLFTLEIVHVSNIVCSYYRYYNLTHTHTQFDLILRY